MIDSRIQLSVGGLGSTVKRLGEVSYLSASTKALIFEGFSKIPHSRIL